MTNKTKTAFYAVQIFYKDGKPVDFLRSFSVGMLAASFTASDIDGALHFDAPQDAIRVANMFNSHFEEEAKAQATRIADIIANSKKEAEALAREHERKTGEAARAIPTALELTPPPAQKQTRQ